jgi:hypothetical protein
MKIKIPQFLYILARLTAKKREREKERFREHLRQFKTNNSRSVCTLHIIHNKRERWFPMGNTMNLIEAVQKGWPLNCLETMCIKQYRLQGKLISERDCVKSNSVYEITYDVKLQHACA